MSNQLELVILTINKTKQLIELANEAQDWDSFFELEKQRQVELKQINLISDDFKDKQLIEITKYMEELMALNQQLEEICQIERLTLLNNLQTIQKGKKVSRAYTA